MTNHPIVWAIDPYQKNPRAWKRSKELAKCTSRVLKRSLQPVYVADRGLVPRPSESKPLDLANFVESSKTRLDKLLKPFRAGRVSKPEVLFTYGFDTEADVGVLDNYAVARATPMILSVTTARHGIRRFFEGSFAETLVGRSRVPVLLVNPHCRPVHSIKNILFATDFSPLSSKAFRKLCETARSAKASIEILSVQPDPTYWAESGFAMTAGTGAYLGLDIIKSENKRLRRAGERLVQLARKLKVKATFKLEEKPFMSVSAAVLKEAKAFQADMIALAARGDTSKVHLFGSTTQDVIRQSRLPVWTYHHGKSS